MADSHPFANAGLGMFGAAEKQYAQSAMHAQKPKEGGDILGGWLASLIGLSSQDKNEAPVGAVKPTAPVQPAAPVTQYEPQTAFPDILQQQYVSPYIPGYTPPAGAVAPGLQGFKQSPFATQQQAPTTSGYHPTTDALWGGK